MTRKEIMIALLDGTEFVHKESGFRLYYDKKDDRIYEDIGLSAGPIVMFTMLEFDLNEWDAITPTDE